MNLEPDAEDGTTGVAVAISTSRRIRSSQREGLALTRVFEPYCEKERVMSNEALLLSIMVLVVVTFYSALSVTPVLVDRMDAALSGIVKGLPVSTQTRRLLLITQAVPLCAFISGFLLVVGLGILEMSKGAEGPHVKIVGSMAASLAFIGALAYLGMGGVWWFHVWSALRKTSRT